MKTLFVQLPKQDSTCSSAYDNVPLYAANYISFIKHNLKFDTSKLIIADQNCCDYGSDSALRAYITSIDPELVVFTLYSWNTERSKSLAYSLRQQMPKTYFIACGPIVNSQLYGNKIFDSILEGECEEIFPTVIADAQSMALKPRYFPITLPELYLLPNPYLSKVLEITKEKPLVLEIGRGSNTRADFLCDRGQARFFNPDVIPIILERASEISEAAKIIGPDIDEAPEFETRLKAIAAANKGKLIISAKIKPSKITKDCPQIMQDASMMYISTTLGTINKEVGKKVNIYPEPEKFEKQVKNIWAQGIIIKPIIYAGLPNDDVVSIEKTFDFLGMIGIGQDTKLCPLSIRPDSKIFINPQEYGIQCIMDKEPYYVLETAEMNAGQIYNSIANFEDSFDVAYSVPASPCFKSERNGFTSYIDLRNINNFNQLLVNQEKLSSSVTLLVDIDNTDHYDTFLKAAPILCSYNPYNLWQIVFLSDKALPSFKMGQDTIEAFANVDHYYNLTNFFSSSPQKFNQVKVFFATHSEELALYSLKERIDLETIFIPQGSMPKKELCELIPYIVYDRHSMPYELLYDIENEWRQYADLILESDYSL